MTAVRAGTTAGSEAVPVLMYHSISDRSTPRFAPYAVPPGLFAEHMGALRGAGCFTTTVTGLTSARAAGRPLPERTVVVTFDDAYRDFLTHALPLLQAHDVRATLYVPTRDVGGTSRWLAPEGEQDRPLLDWTELREVVAAGVEVGAHTHSHPQLDLLPRAEVAREVALPKVVLEDALQLPVTSLAYPFGYARRATRDLVSRLGYASACVVADLVSDAGDDCFAVPRLTVTAHLSADDLLGFVGTASSPRQRQVAASRSTASHLLRRLRLKKRANRYERGT